MTVSPWDAPDMRKKLEELWPNHSAAQIVKITGISTRNGVIGAANRFGLPSKGRGYNQYEGNRQSRIWTEARLVDAQRAYEQGLTIGVIAQDLGVSYQSVTTAAKRHGWRRPPPQPRPAPAKRERPPPRPSVVAKPVVLKLAGNGQVFHEAEQRPPKVRHDPRLWAALPGITPVTLMDVGRLQCRWPIDPEMCCGAPVEHEKKSYCATHATWSVVRKKEPSTS